MNQYDGLITGTGYWHRHGSSITLDDPFAGAAETEHEGPIELAVRLAITMGNRDENSLTNLVFFARHPERRGRPIDRTDPDFSTLSKEWLDIRNTIVKPMLRSTAGTSSPPASSSIPSGSKGPLPLVSTPIPPSGPGFTTSGTRVKYGIPETIDALMWIGAEWGRRHPDVTFMVRDISRLGGGKQAPHKSHRIGLDADVQLLKDGKKMDVTGRDYPAFQPYVQDLVNIIESNPVLPVKVIGIKDPLLKGRTVSQWDGHVRHLHVRFCMPLSRRAELDTKKVGGTPASYYRCASSEQEFEGIFNEAEVEHAWEGVRY
ncbi:MAG: penicillin-insensitive murein endopeptidase [Pseudonocardiales bacterium]